MSGALGVLFPWVSGPHPDPAESLAAFERIDAVLCTDPAAGTGQTQTGGFDPTAPVRGDRRRPRRQGTGPPPTPPRAELTAAGYEVRNDPQRHRRGEGVGVNCRNSPLRRPAAR